MLERVANALGLDQRIAVAVAANPGAEVHQVGHVDSSRIDAIDVAELFHDFRVDLGQRVE